MKVLIINNVGCGFADYIDIEPGTTVAKLFAQQLPNQSPEDYLIRVNRLPVNREQVLQESDRISFAATKIHGARSRGRAT